jgi:hypothetical protein
MKRKGYSQLCHFKFVFTIWMQKQQYIHMAKLFLRTVAVDYTQHSTCEFDSAVVVSELPEKDYFNKTLGFQMKSVLTS